jgi:SAM-dependent methyltransferase
VTSSHWATIWREHAPEELSWYQPVPSRSLGLVTAFAAPEDPVIDVGAGASALVDGLLDAGFDDVTVLDVAPAALEAARRRLGPRAGLVTWIAADVLEHRLDRRYALWHDRAVFHFLVEPADRARYVAQVDRAVRPGGHLVLATFGPDGPTSCSGLPVQRYGEAAMAAALGCGFDLDRYTEDVHVTPTGAEQQFAFGVFTRRS